MRRENFASGRTAVIPSGARNLFIPRKRETLRCAQGDIIASPQRLSLVSRREVEDSVSGFTLLEVSVALAILSMGLTVLLGGVRQGIQAFARSRDMITVQALARHILTLQQLDDTTPLDGDVRTGDFGSDFPEYKYEVRYDLNEQFEALRTAVNMQQQGQQDQLTHAVFVVTVTVLWEEDGAEQSYTLRSARVYETAAK